MSKTAEELRAWAERKEFLNKIVIWIDPMDSDFFHIGTIRKCLSIPGRYLIQYICTVFTDELESLGYPMGDLDLENNSVFIFDPQTQEWMTSNG